MPTGNDKGFRTRWLAMYHRLGHSLAVFPGMVVAYGVGLLSTDFSFVTILVLILGLEIAVIGASWVGARYFQRSDKNG